MLKQLRQKIVVPTAIQCVELRFLSMDKYSVSLLTVKKTKASYTVVSFKEEIDSILELLKVVDISIPVILSVNGKIVIDKKIRYKEGESDTELLKRALPNATTAEFILQRHPFTLVGSTLVSVVRKKIIDDIINELYDHKLIVIGSQIGSFCIPALHSHLNKKDNLLFNGFRYLFSDGKLSDVTEDEDENDKELTLNFGGSILSESYFIPLAAVLEFYKNFPFSANSVSKIKEFSTEFVNKKISKAILFSSLGTILLILLINFIYFSQLTEISNKLISDKSGDEEILRKYENLKKEVNEKNNLIDAIGLKSTQAGSFYADEIAGSVPETITLNEMNFQPILFNSGSHDKTDISYKEISVSGNCTSSITLNDWVKKMKSQNWCANITIANYNFETDKNQAKFLLSIKIK